MGFSGKPSKACEPCRCRRTRPCCGQCQRKGINCSYRDIFNASFRNENEAIIRKMHRARQSSLNALATTNQSQTKPTNHSCPVVLEISRESAATAFFMSRFAYGIYHDYVPTLYKNKECSAALKSSVEAVGLAALSLARSESRLLEEARICHLDAVKNVQLSLQSPTSMNRADTLASVMLLALFAGMTCAPTAAHINWTKHIKGALAILTSSSFVHNDPVVSILSSQVTSCVLVDCLQSAVAPPVHSTEIKFEPRIPINFQEKSEYILHLLAEVRSRKLTEKNAIDMVVKLDMIDVQLADLFHILSKKHPRTSLSDDVRDHQPIYHIYPNLQSARVWNIIRLTKLSAAELRYGKMLELRDLAPESIDHLNVNFSQQEQYASTSAKSMIYDICASVPDLLRPTESPCAPTKFDELDAINWAHSLLWPVSAARASIHAPESLRTYMHDTLQKLWDLTKFPVVDYHRKDIDQEIPPHIWTHVFFFMC